MEYNPPIGSTDQNASYEQGNPSSGQRGSLVPAGAIEFPQREVVNVIEQAGLSPTNNNLGQLYEAIEHIANTIAEGLIPTYTASLGVTKVVNDFQLDIHNLQVDAALAQADELPIYSAQDAKAEKTTLGALSSFIANLINNQNSSGSGGRVACWARVAANGTILAGSGISSVSTDGAGNYTVTLAAAMPDANYGILLSPFQSNNYVRTAAPFTQTTTQITLQIDYIIYNGYGTFTNAANDDFTIAIIH